MCQYTLAIWGKRADSDRFVVPAPVRNDDKRARAVLVCHGCERGALEVRSLLRDVAVVLGQYGQLVARQFFLIVGAAHVAAFAAATERICDDLFALGSSVPVHVQCKRVPIRVLFPNAARGHAARYHATCAIIRPSSACTCSIIRPWSAWLLIKYCAGGGYHRSHGAKG